MKQRWLHIGGWALGLTLALSGCAKEFAPDEYDVAREGEGPTTMAIGTLRIQDGVRTVWVDEATLVYVTNPDRISDLDAGTRIFLEYQPIKEHYPDYCTEAVYVLWASALDVGVVSTAKSALGGDPVDIITDWTTSLEGSFLTIHYRVRASGNVQHTFTLARAEYPGEIVFLHDAHGDTVGDLTEGIVCFPIVSLLPEGETDSITFSLDYINLQHTQTRLTFDYRIPE